MTHPSASPKDGAPPSETVAPLCAYNGAPETNVAASQNRAPLKESSNVATAIDPHRPTAGGGAPGRGSWFASGPAIVLYIAAALFVLLIAYARQYGYFRDELYYLACAEHIDFGYVDQPPLIALVTWLATHVFGTGLIGLRLLPAAAGAGTLVLAGALAREMGGRRFAQAFAAICVALAPITLGLSHILTMNAFEPLFWMGCAYVLLRIAKTGDQRLWIAFGVVAGIGLQNKYSMAFFGAALMLGLLLTPLRKSLAQRWIWIGGAMAFLIVLPNLIWEIRYHFPFFELMHNVRASGRDVVLNPPGFLGQQAMIMHPLTFLLVVPAGLWFLFFDREGRRYRVLGWAYVAILLFFVLTHGKNYYLAPAYAMMFAAGAVWFERITELSGRGSRAALTAVLVVTGVLIVPMSLPVLSPAHYIAYTRKLHLAPPSFEHQMNGPLGNQIFADMFGWDEMARNVAIAWHSLPPGQRERTAIVANGYGQSGAIDFFGPKYDLPKSIGVHQSYWLWGPGDYTLRSILVMGDRYEVLASKCGKVTKLGEVSHPLSRRDEHWDILLCENNTDAPFTTIWPKLKKWG